MPAIVVTTDFSPRSDRALRRAVLIAHQLSAELVLVHALDDDLPASLLATQREACESLLAEMAQTITQIDQTSCRYLLTVGDPFRALLDASCEIAPELIIMGPHRRSLLKDVFVGTTAERIIRESRIAIVTANGVPASVYQRITVASDLSDCSANAMSTAKSLGLLDRTSITLLHVLDTPETMMMQRAFRSGDEIEDYILDIRSKALNSLNSLALRGDIRPDRTIVEQRALSVADTIKSVVEKDGSDLLVIGTHGGSGLKNLFLGGVAEELLRHADIDVLAVPYS